MIASYIVVFTCVWWIVFYMSLPFGVKVIKASKDGFDRGAPQNPHIGIKMAITTIITVFLTIGIINFIEDGYLAKFTDNYLRFFAIKI